MATKVDPQESLRQDLGLAPGQSIELLKSLHILTREGRINQDSRRKLKQVLHLCRFIEERLQTYPADHELTLADHGAGKSYLGFMIHDLYLRHRHRSCVYGIESRSELVEGSRALALQLGFDRMRFVDATVAETLDRVDLPAHIDVVTALHACDGATDDAIEFALRRTADHVVLVPCCQAEAARILGDGRALSLSRTPLAELWRHPLHTREVGSQITNVMRCLYLEACGYSVTVTELVGWEHSLKNELILAKKTGQPRRGAAVRLRELIDAFGLQALATQRYSRIAQTA